MNHMMIITNQLKAAGLLKQSRKYNKIRLIASIMTSPFFIEAPLPFVESYFFKAKVLGAVLINLWPALTFLIKIETIESRSSCTWKFFLLFE